jgi:glycosyltransferase involved in cell wall biosynthesis
MAKTGLDMSAKFVPVPPAVVPKELVSILVPSYNYERYVIECLETIKSLNYRRLEVILSDDCSRDSTYLLAEQWAQKNADRFERTLIVRQEKNFGITKNLQFLFDKAQGEYLAYIASDDLFVASSIADRENHLREHKSLDGVIGNSRLISESGSVLCEQRIPAHISNDLCGLEPTPRFLIWYWRFMCFAALIRKRAFMEDGSVGRLPEDLKIEDRYLIDLSYLQNSAMSAEFKS